MMRQHAAALLHRFAQSAATAGYATLLREPTASAFARSACCSSSTSSALPSAASVSGRCLATPWSLHGGLWSGGVQRHAASFPMQAGTHAEGRRLLQQLCHQGQRQVQMQPGCLRGFASVPEQVSKRQSRDRHSLCNSSLGNLPLSTQPSL